MRLFRGFLLGGVGCFAVASAVVAADLDLPPAPPPPVSGGPRWDGPYIGVNAGWGAATGNDASTTWFKNWPSISADPVLAPLPANTPPNAALRFSPSGFAGGAQVGFNKQFGSLVFGVETDYDYVAARSSASTSGIYSGATLGGTPFSGAYTMSQSQQLNSLGTIRAKLGFTPMDDLLLYATGGLAFGQTNVSSGTSIPNTGGVLPNGAAFTGTRDNWAVGYAIGGGAEYALDRNWSVRAEAIYYDLGHSSVVGVANIGVNNPGGPDLETDTNSTFKGYMLRLGLNYEFDGQDGPAYQDAADRLSDAAQDIKVTVGSRVGISTSNAQMTLYDATGQTRLSRLTYHDPSSTTGEVYARIDDSSGVFMKGYIGMGTESGGHLQDEDFPPGISPYSSTNSAQQYGHLEYFSADAGYYVYSDSQYKLGGLAGWHYLDEAFNAYGCTQTASNTQVCPPGAVSGNNLTISDEGRWNSIRLGIVGEATLGGGFSVRGEAVWLPFSYFTASNDHWLRMPSDFQGAIPESGIGHTGYQLEGELNYAVTRNFDIGVGARFWSLNATGKSDFNEATPYGEKQVATFETQRFQAFAQTSYRF
jgi:opacity protein-like surface antigen